jgi:hypothetical protein
MITITTAVRQIATTLPITPPTMGPAGTEEGGGEVGVGVSLDVVVVVEGGGVTPTYCVPVLAPREPVK